MNQDILSLIESCKKADSYLKNASQVFDNLNKEYVSDTNKAKKSLQARIRSIEQEASSSVKEEKEKCQALIDKDNERYAALSKNLNSLARVDKKFKKMVEKLNDFSVPASIQTELENKIGIQAAASDSTEKILQYVYSNSSKYIIKPVPSIIPLTKKRKQLYIDLITCKSIFSIYQSENKKRAIDVRDTKIAEIQKRATEEIDRLTKSFDKSLEKSNKDNGDDVSYIIDTCKEQLVEIYGEDFFDEAIHFDEKKKALLSNINMGDEFPEGIYIGEIAYPLMNYSKTIIKAFTSCFDLIEDEVLFLPATLSLHSSTSLICLSKSSADRKEAVSFVNSIIYSFIRQIPIAGLEITIFDPDGKGNAIYPFLNMNASIPGLFAKKIYTSSDDIHSRLIEINDYIDSVIQQKLSNRYKDIFEYDQATKDNPLQVKLLCIFNTSKISDERDGEMVLSIIKNAKRCGIFTLIVPDEKTFDEESAQKMLVSLAGDCTTLVFSNSLISILDSDLAFLPIDLPKQEKIDDLTSLYGKSLKAKLSQGIPFTSIIQEGELFSKKSADGISLPVGKGDGSVTQYIDFGQRSSQHAIITGATGSGKSTLLHTIIMSAILNYSPEELNLYLMDFKSGTEFKIYETIKVPHIKLLALDALQEFGESILMELVAEQNRRSQLFKDSGEYTNLKAYVTATGKKLPRILVVIDEFQILFNESSNRKVAQHCAELVNKIVTEGRAFGIHLIMATQTLRSIREKTTISNSTLEQMRIRIGLKCGEDDASYIFGENNAKDALSKMKGAIGTAVYNPEFTEANNQGFRVAYCSEKEQRRLLEEVKAFCERKCTVDMRVFEGKRIPELNLKRLERADQSEIKLALGEPIRVDEPVSLSFNKKFRNNLLIVGADEKLAGVITDNILLQLSLSAEADITYILGQALFEEPLRSYTDQVIQSDSKIAFIKTRSEILLTIERLYDEFKKRRKGLSTDRSFQIVIIDGLQYIDILISILKGDKINRDDYIEPEKKEDKAAKDDFDFDFLTKRDEYDYSEMLSSLIENGYSYGFNFIIYSNDYQTVKDALRYGSNLLSKISHRIIFALSDKDADELIDGISLSNLNSITAVYTDGIRKTLQFKPYALPKIEEVETKIGGTRDER